MIGRSVRPLRLRVHRVGLLGLMTIACGREAVPGRSWEHATTDPFGWSREGLEAVRAHRASLPENGLIGKPFGSMVYVTAPGFRSDLDLANWLTRALAFARSLPAT